MSNRKRGFVFYFDNILAVDSLPPDQRGWLLSALCSYADRVWQDTSVGITEYCSSSWEFPPCRRSPAEPAVKDREVRSIRAGLGNPGRPEKRAGAAAFRRFRRTLRRAFRVPLHGRGGYGAIFVFRDLGCRCPWNSPHFVLIWKGPEKERHAKLRRQSRVSLFSQNTWAAVRALASQGGEATLEPALHSTGPVQTSAGCLHPFAAAAHIPVVALPTGSAVSIPRRQTPCQENFSSAFM